MTPDRYARICELFDQAVKLAPTERHAFLKQACGDDTSLHAEVEQMLAKDRDGQTANILTLPELLNLRALLPPREPDVALSNRRIGPYQLRQQLGSGGMGTVYLATRVDDYQQHVALKVIRRGLDTQELVQRFRNERQLLAGLNHANIARLLDGGATDDGLPYLVMEFIEGQAIDRYCDTRQLHTDERVKLLRSVCQAMDYAHKQGVIHRDLKPGNILVTADGTAKVVDFGLAKQLEGEPGASASGLVTQTGAILGTPSYMAPEQAGGETKKAGPPADIYALGAILYELLTGRPPFRADTPLDTLMQVLADDPVPPSQLHPKLARDLETICLKCLEKDPRKRYASAEALADDLGRFLDGEPILARPVTKLERVWRWCRRYPVVAGLTAAMALLLLSVAVGATVAAVNFRYMAEQEKLLKDASEKTNVKLKETNEELEASLYLQRIAIAERELTMRQDVGRAEALLHECPARLRGWEWHYLQRLLDGERPPLDGHRRGLWSVAFAPDGKQLASAGIDGTVKLWDASTGKELLTFDRHIPDLVRLLPGDTMFPLLCVAFSPDGQRIASAGPAAVKVWNPHTGKEIVTYQGHSGLVVGVTFSPDGKRVASSGFDKTIQIWDAETGKTIHTLKGHTDWINRLAFSPDGKRLGSPSMDGTIKLWDPATGQELKTLTEQGGPVRDLEFSRDGRWLASAGMDGTVKLWDAETLQVVRTMPGHTGGALGVGFSPDGKRLASVGFDKTVKVWDPATGREAITLRGHTDTIWSVAFSSDGRRLASASFDKTVRIWDATPLDESAGPKTVTPQGHTDRVNYVTFSRDGKELASTSWDQTVRVWNAETGTELHTLSGHTGAVWCAAFSPNGALLASASWDKTVKLWDLKTGKEIRTLSGHSTLVHGVAFSPDGRWIASTCVDGTVKVWEVATGKDTRTLRGHQFMTYCVAFSPEGKRLASAGGDRVIQLWDFETGKTLRTLKGHSAVIHAIAFSPDGKQLVSASWDQTLKLWDVETGIEVLPGRFLGHSDRVHGVAFSSDGKHIISAAEDKTVRFWDAATGYEVLQPRVHRGVVWSVACSPDGRHVASACWYLQGGIRVWEPGFSAPPR